MFNAPLPFGLLSFPQIWLALPLALAFSFCYAASRSENAWVIVSSALKNFFWLCFFLTLVGVVLYFAI